MAFTPSPEFLADHFEFVTSRAIRLKPGYAFVTGTLDDDIGNSAGEDVQVISDTFQIMVSDGEEYTDLSGAGTSNADAAYADLTDYTQCRISTTVTTAGVTGRLALWFASADVVASNSIDLSVEGVANTEWENIPTAARTIQNLGVAAFGGDESEDPEVGAVIAHFRR